MGKNTIDKAYDFIIGMDFIETNVKNIDIKKQEMILNNDTAIPFLNKKIQEDVNMLEESDLGNIKLNHLNKEEKEGMSKLLEKFK